MDTENLTAILYSPLAVLDLFNNSISVSQTRKLIQLRGIYVPGNGAIYNGCYYDWLHDESSDALPTIITPALIRNELQPNKTITPNGFITQRVVNNASRIDIQFTVTDFIEQRQNKCADEDLEKIELLQAQMSKLSQKQLLIIKRRDTLLHLSPIYTMTNRIVLCCLSGSVSLTTVAF